MENIPIPKGMLKSNRIQYWFWMVLNIVAAFLFAAADFEYEV
jgi:hypothetical protein